MTSVASPGSADEALEMLQAAMGYLAAADATAMTAQEQARCLRVLERAGGYGGADLGAGRVRLRPGPRRGRRVQPAGLAGPARPG